MGPMMAKIVTRGVCAVFESCSRVGECKNAAKDLLSAMPKKRSPVDSRRRGLPVS